MRVFIIHFGHYRQFSAMKISITFAGMTEKILILDFGSQFTQLIARAVREANVFCEIIPQRLDERHKL